MFGIKQDTTSATIAAQPPSIENSNVPSALLQNQTNNILPPPPPLIEPDHSHIATGTDTEARNTVSGSQDIVPQSEQWDPDIVPSSWNTEENAVASSGG